MRTNRFIRTMWIMLCPGAVCGCALGNRPSLVQVGSSQGEKTFYLDGAGNVGFGKESVPLGLADGGYEGRVEHFIWTTYLGPFFDQVSLSHNRRQADRLARRIESYLDERPRGQVNVIGLSAGTGIAVFGLEAMRSGYRVDNVVLLSSSLSAEYDLTKVLANVNGGVHFFWCPHDPVLAHLVPLVGTVDRASSGAAVAGITGSRVPRNASSETERLYRERVHNVRWSPASGPAPLGRRHIGSISRATVRDLVAPILVGKRS